MPEGRGGGATVVDGRCGRCPTRKTTLRRAPEPKNLGKIFEPFFTTRAEGTGLGLAIVQKLVRAHRGEVRVDPQPGAGSRFTVLLPA